MLFGGRGGGNLFCILGFFLKVSVQDGSIFGGLLKLKKNIFGYACYSLY